MQTQDRVQNPNLVNKRVFNQVRKKFGIPDKVFVGVLVMWCVGAGVAFYYAHWAFAIVFTVVFGGLLFIPVYLIHQDDDEAAFVWLRALFVPSRFTQTYAARRRVLIIVPEGDRLAARSLEEGKFQ